MTVFTGEVHPAAASYPLLPDDQLDAMADDIAANGLRDPIVLDQAGVLIDGRNRLAACERAGVEPTFEVREFADDDEIEAFVLSVNVEKRSLTAGQKAMFRAMSYARQGKRRNGRWSRGTLDNRRSSDSDGGWLKAMERAGLILDVAERAAALGEDFAGWATLPQRVRSGEVALDAAHRSALKFDQTAAMAEMLARQPLGEYIAYLQTAVEDLQRRHPEPPAISVPVSEQDAKQLRDLAGALSALAVVIRVYVKAVK